MYPHLMTSTPRLSPLMGLLKIDQLAFAAYSDEDEAAIKKQLRLTEANWVEDWVVASGYVRGGRAPGAPRADSSNTAKLLFNYDLGLEVEILRYVSGPNYLEAAGVKPCHLCHIGAHVEKGMEIPQGLKDFTVGAPIIQQVETEQHTNPFLVETGRRYRYTIYDTQALFGTFFKVIERLEAK